MNRQQRAVWVHALGCSVAQAMTAAIVQLRAAGEHNLATAVTACKLDWERAIRRRCDELERKRLQERTPPVMRAMPIRGDDWHACVQVLRSQYAPRDRPPLRLVLARDSVSRMRREAEQAGHGGALDAG